MGKLIFYSFLIVFLSFKQCAERSLNFNDLYRKKGEEYLFSSLNENTVKKVLKRYNDFNNTELIVFTDTMSVYDEKYYFVTDNSKKEILKAPFNINCYQSDKIKWTWENSFHCLIKLKTFNSLLIKEEKKSKDGVMDFYFNLLNNNKGHTIINDSIDSYQLYRSNKKIILSRQIVKDVLNNENKVFCLFSNLELYAFHFHFKHDKQIEKIESDFLGDIGNVPN